MKCPKCNSILPDDSEFCQFCGTKIANAIAGTIDEPIKQNITIEKENLSKQENINAPVFISSTNNAQTNQKPNKKSKKDQYCKACGGHIDSKTKKCDVCGKQYFKFRPLVLTVVLLAIFLVASAGFNVYQYYIGQENNVKIDEIRRKITSLERTVSSQKATISTQKTKISSLEKKVDDLEDEKWDTFFELNFYEKYAAIVCDDGTKKYHVYGCKDCDTSSFWIYNINAAEDNGYYACPKCH